MCGIVGVAWTDKERRTPAGLIGRMADLLTHRGPDGSGVHEAPGISLGHRRLSIIDLAGGAQPLANEDQTVWVVFNGEIYNFADLRDDLLARGHVLQTRSDTEVLVHLYEDLGPAMLDRLRGMFAFGLWDTKTRTLLIARDRLGVKPLYYRHDADGIRFASELKSLLIEPGAPRRLSPAALDDYLTYQYVPGPGSIFEGYEKLPGGHYAIWRDGKLTVSRYWRPPFEHEEPLGEAEYIDRLRQTLTEATKIRLVSDVPLGAFLSGGIDSTIVVGLMRQAGGSPVKTFSIGFEQKDFDERTYARAAAQWLGAEHHEFLVKPDAVDIAPRLAWHYDEPFADSSAIPTYYVSQVTRRHVTVALTGDGGDELFGGYTRYQAVLIGEWFDRLPGWLRGVIAARRWQDLPASVRQRSVRRRFKRLVGLLAEAPPVRYRAWVSIFADALRRELYSPDFRAQLGAHHSSDALDRYYAELPGRDFATRTMYVDLLSYLPGDILTKVDIASMANSLECRGPFLDQEVVALAGRMPRSLKLRGRQTKRILKKAFADLLPPSIRRRGKMGFGVPIDSWLRGELAPMLQDLLRGQRFRERGWFDQAVVERLIEEHLDRHWDHSIRLWALIMLEWWARQHLDQPAA